MLEEWHGILDRHQLMLEACDINSVSEEDYLDLGRAGLGNCLLGGLPDWLVAYSARLVCHLSVTYFILWSNFLSSHLFSLKLYFC